MTTTHDTSLDGLRHTIADLLKQDPATIAGDINLFELGLDSIFMMRLVNGWRRSGLQVNFADLATAPTLADWARLLTPQTDATAALTPAPPPQATADAAATDAAATDAPPDTIPLALMQHAYWAGRGDGPELGGVAAHLYCEFDHPAPGLDPERLRAALDRLVARHETLRMQVTPDGRQRIGQSAGRCGLVVHDLRSAQPAAVPARLDAVRAAQSHQVLDIEAGEVMAVAVSLLPDGGTRLHLDVDMIAADAVSYRVLLADLADYYADPDRELPPVGYTFRAYCRDRPVARAAAAERAAGYWAGRLADLPAAPELPRTVEAPTGPPRVARRFFVLAEPQRGALVAAARARGLTPAVVFATVFAEVVGWWSAQRRFLLNVPLFDRAPLHPDIERVVGDFSSSVLLAVDLDPDRDLTASARAAQRRLHADAAYADRSGVEVLRDLTRLRGEPVLAPVVFTSALSLGELFGPSVRNRLGEPVWIISQGPQVLLDAQVTEVSDGVLVNWDSREDEFPDGVLDAMFGAFERLMHDLATDPAAWDAPAAHRLPAVGPPPRRSRPAATTRSGLPPDGPLEQAIALVWTTVLGTVEIRRDDDYFAVGGDSVLATAIVRELRDALDTDTVSIATLLAAPTVGGMAERLLAEEPAPGLLAQAAEIYLEVAALSDDEVAEALDEGVT